MVEDLLTFTKPPCKEDRQAAARKNTWPPLATARKNIESHWLASLYIEGFACHPTGVPNS
jgi:hypothetical protein